MGNKAAHGMLKFKCGMVLPPPCLALLQKGEQVGEYKTVLDIVSSYTLHNPLLPGKRHQELVNSGLCSCSIPRSVTRFKKNQHSRDN